MTILENYQKAFAIAKACVKNLKLALDVKDIKGAIEIRKPKETWYYVALIRGAAFSTGNLKAFVIQNNGRGYPVLLGDLENKLEELLLLEQL